MRFRTRFFAVIGMAIAVWHPVFAQACDVCGCSFNTKRSGHDTVVGSTILTPTAETVGQGRGFAGVLFEQQRDRTIPASEAHALHHQDRDVHDKTHEETYALTAGWGVRDDLDLSVTLPVVSRSSLQIEHHDRLGQVDRSSGVGDLRLVGKYRFWNRGVSAALLAGVKMPTGKVSSVNTSGDKAEPELQPGTGSWDATAGLAASRSFLGRWTLASAVQYTARGEGAQDEKLGDVFRYDLGMSYALTPLGRIPNLSLVGECQLQWAAKDRARGRDKVLDSGGTTLFLSPGLSADLTRSLSAFLAAPIPVYQDLGGLHVKTTYEILAGASWHF